MYKILTKNISYPSLTMPVSLSALIAATGCPIWFHYVVWAIYVPIAAKRAYSRLTRQERGVDIAEMLKPLWHKQELKRIEMNIERYKNLSPQRKASQFGKAIRSEIRKSANALEIKDGDWGDLQNKLNEIEPYIGLESQNSPV